MVNWIFPILLAPIIFFSLSFHPSLNVEFGTRESILHVSSVAEIKATLVSSFIGSILERDDCVAGPQLFFGELASVLLGLLGSNRRLAVLGSLRDKWQELNISTQDSC